MDAAIFSYLGALVAIIAYGSYMAPLKKWPAFPQYATLSAQSCGILVISIIIAQITSSWTFSFVGFICGFVWHFGAGLCFSAVKNESDLSGTSVRTMGMCILSSFVAGSIISKEEIFWPLAVTAIFILGLGLFILSPDFSGIKKKWRSLLAGFIFGVHLIPFQLSGFSALEFALPYAIGIFAGSNLLFLRKLHGITLKGHSYAPWIVSFFAGAFWMCGTHGSFLAIAPEGGLGYSVGYPLTQLNLLVNIAIGVFLFGEYPGKKARIKLLLAALIILSGAVLLTVAKLMV